MHILAVLLLILKIIGIILLSVLGIVIAVLALLLFYPCFYSAEASYGDGYKASASAVWLTVKFVFDCDDEKGINKKIILPFGLNSDEKKAKKQEKQRKKNIKQRQKRARAAKKAAHKSGKANLPKDKPNKDEKPKIKQASAPNGAEEQTKPQIKEEHGTDSTPVKQILNTEEVKDKFEESSSVQSPKSSKKGFLESIKAVPDKIRTAAETLKKAAQFPKKAYDFAAEKYGEIKEMNQKYNFKAVTKRTFIFFNKFFVGLGLKKFHFCGIIGLGDPADTGMALGAVSIAASLIPFPVDVSGNFEEKQLDINADLKGRTNLFRILFPILMYILSKPIFPIVKEYVKKK